MPFPFSDLRSVSCRASVLCLSWPSASDFSRLVSLSDACIACLYLLSMQPAAGINFCDFLQVLLTD